MYAAGPSKRLMCKRIFFSLGKFPATKNDLMLVFQNREVSNTSGQHTGLDLFVNVISAEATLKELLFNLCQDCKERMSCIPPSAFSAKRIRESQREMKVATPNKQEPSSKYFNTMLMELSPLQYNSKMMNSVWGLYNRYSSHNVKTNNDVCGLQSQEVQPNAASSKNDSVINFSGKVKLDNFWTAFNFSQSH